MSLKFTILETNLLHSPEFQTLTPRARLLFIDVVTIGKAANRMGLFDPLKSKPFRFHPHMANGPIQRTQFYEHVRTFEEVGLIDINRAARSGLPQFLKFNGKYAQLLKPHALQLTGGPLKGLVPDPSGAHLLKDSTFRRTNVNVSFHIPSAKTTYTYTAAGQAAQPTGKDDQLDHDLAAIPNRIAQWARVHPITGHGIVKMAQDLKRTAWARYRARQDTARLQDLDVAGALEDLTRAMGNAFVPETGEWTKPTASVKTKIVDDILSATGDVPSLDNWRLLVHRMSTTEQGFNALQGIVYDFIDELARKDPRATTPKSPGALLNHLLRAECTRQPIDLSPRATTSPQGHNDRPS